MQFHHITIILAVLAPVFTLGVAAAPRPDVDVIEVATPIESADPASWSIGVGFTY